MLLGKSIGPARIGNYHRDHRSPTDILVQDHSLWLSVAMAVGNGLQSVEVQHCAASWFAFETHRRSD